MSNQINNLVTALAAATNHDDEALAPPAASPAKRRSGKSSKKGGVISKEKRLEQNRKAAIESRRRKKVMVSDCLATVERSCLVDDCAVHADLNYLLRYASFLTALLANNGHVCRPPSLRRSTS